MRDNYFQEKPNVILLFIKLTPNARRDEVLGTMAGADGLVLGAKVRAIADKGKANKALIALMSKWLGVAKSKIDLKSGSKSRIKTLAITGDSDELATLIVEKLTN
ncbi:MAG: DUF167 domain-containing protein [bacterium]|nr:DUF167 domain-containing protein [bacterium]